MQNLIAQTHVMTQLTDLEIKVLLLFSMADHKTEYQTALVRLLMAGKLHAQPKSTISAPYEP